ncbi:MAG: hypothetical protein ACKV22_01540 [Bryobacteraceae bacterium]
MRWVLCILPLVAAAAPPHSAGKRELNRSCRRCHELNVVRAQRLSRHDWERELEKMVLMGARIRDRASLLDYLSATYGEEKR